VMDKSIAPDLNDPLLNNLRDKHNVVQQKMLGERDFLGQYKLPSDLDTWSGYLVARPRFYQIAKEANAQELLVISGDSHNQLFDDNAQSVGIELGATTITLLVLLWNWAVKS
jgi:alkaline phosphatase D